MKFRPLKQAPVLIAVCVIALVCLTRLLNLDFLDRLERMTYDKRVRTALNFPLPAATNLGFVFMSDQSIEVLNHGLLGKSYGLYWPRHVYGRLLRELVAQGAQAVAFDVVFGEPRPDHAPEPVPTARWPELTNFLARLHPHESPTTYERGGKEFVLAESDDIFAWQLHRAGMAVLAAKDGLLPASLFATNALTVADISADPDHDGVLRRARAFGVYTNWHPLFKQAEADESFGLDLRRAILKPGKIVLPRKGLDAVEVPVDKDNNFELADFVGDKLPPGMPPKAKAFTIQRVWHMGVVLAARALSLDLERAEVDLENGSIRFRGPNGIERLLPVDRTGFFPVNWEITATDSRLITQPIEQLLARDLSRGSGDAPAGDSRWRGQLALVGSTATGNDLTDRGATPIEESTLLATEHFNVANSIITGRFVRRPPLTVELLLITLLSIATALLTWQTRVMTASASVVLLVVLYAGTALLVYVQHRLWLPIVFPILGAMIMQHVCLVTYRVVFEQRERRRVLSVFDKMVSPNVAREVLRMETLALGGSRREITVYFADVRGFTELTDGTNERATEFVTKRQLAGAAADAVFDEHARETLETVNTYLSLVADIVKQHDGTLDKYIGDCVMSYWGAPTSNPHHARDGVLAAINAQRAIHELNLKRSEENRRREQENPARQEAGQPLLPMLPILYLGSGINSGVAVAGLMGSEKHERSYTVFGREVNLASRLEAVSGRGRIIIGEATYQALVRDDPALATTCVEQEPARPKGFQKPIRNWEVPWQTGAPAPGSSAKPA